MKVKGFNEIELGDSMPLPEKFLHNKRDTMLEKVCG